jgi:phage tail tape-measure protein
MPQECIDKIADVMVSTVAGVALMPYGAFIGASFGAILTPVLGPFGIIAGGFVGGVVGSMLGSKAGMYVMNTVHSMSDAVHSQSNGAATHIEAAVNTTVPVKN